MEKPRPAAEGGGAGQMACARMRAQARSNSAPGLRLTSTGMRTANGGVRRGRPATTHRQCAMMPFHQHPKKVARFPGPCGPVRQGTEPQHDPAGTIPQGPPARCRFPVMALDGGAGLRRETILFNQPGSSAESGCRAFFGRKNSTPMARRSVGRRATRSPANVRHGKRPWCRRRGLPHLKPSTEAVASGRDSSAPAGGGLPWE